MATEGKKKNDAYQNWIRQLTIFSNSHNGLLKKVPRVWGWCVQKDIVSTSLKTPAYQELLFSFNPNKNEGITCSSLMISQHGTIMLA